MLVNAGEDVCSFLQSEFNARQVADDKLEDMYSQLGLTGSTLHERIGGKESARGITAVDVVTRYYRLRNDPLRTVFLIPAYQHHPGTKVTRDMEKVPSVVSVVKPLWPERVSSWEQKQRSALAAGRQAVKDNAALKKKSAHDERNLEFLRLDNEVQRKKVRVFEKLCRDADAKDGFEPNEGRARVLAEQERGFELFRQNQRLRAELDRERGVVDGLRWEVERIRERDVETKRAAEMVQEKLKRVWVRQMEETEGLLIQLGGGKGGEGEAERRVRELVDRALDSRVGGDDV